MEGSARRFVLRQVRRQRWRSARTAAAGFLVELAAALGGHRRRDADGQQPGGEALGSAELDQSVERLAHLAGQEGLEGEPLAGGRVEEDRLGLEAGQPVPAVGIPGGERGEVEEAEVADPEGARRQRGEARRRGGVVGPAGLEHGAVERPAGEVEPDVQLAGGAGVGGSRRIAAAWPLGGQGGGQPDAGAVLDDHRREPIQQRDGDGVGGQQGPGRRFQDPAQRGGPLRREPRVDGLRAHRCAAERGGWREFTAAGASSLRLAAGLAHQPKTRAWTKWAPVSFEVRQTKRVARAASSATGPSTCCRAATTVGTVAFRQLLRTFGWVISPTVPEELSACQPTVACLRLMPMGRNRRPPKDPVNAILSFLYSMLIKQATVAALAVGFDPYLGFYHQPKYGKPALALDLAEEFRPLIADSVCIGLINNGEITPEHLIARGGAVALTQQGRRKVMEAYERRLDTLITHPLFGYRVSYRRIMEVQTRLLGRHLQGELSLYPVFRTR